MLASLAAVGTALLFQGDQGAAGDPVAPAELRGIWAAVADLDLELRVEPDRVAYWNAGELRFHRIARLETDGLQVWTGSGPQGWRLQREGEHLVLDRGDGAERFRRADEAYRTSDPEPMVLGERGELSDERVTQIRADLRARAKRDQEVRAPLANAGAAPPDEEAMRGMRAVDEDNTTWLREVVDDVGWVDAETFGRRAAGDAFLLVQHSSDLGLMLAALPQIEAELEGGARDAQSYALLFDRTQMRLGRPQRYGTQLVGELSGDLHLYPLEDPDGVEERRADLGLFPLQTYLELIEKQMGRPVLR